jgi:hypothetical protein
MGGEDGLDFRQLVEPGEEVLGPLAVLEAQVELLTDGQRETGDFAVARHRGPRERGIVCMRGNDNKKASRSKSYGRYDPNWIINSERVESKAI